MSRTVGYLCVVVLIATFVTYSDSARILGLFSTPSKSHLLIHSAIVDALAQQGHEVTVVTTMPLIKKNPQYKQHIQLEMQYHDFMAQTIEDPPPWYMKYSKITSFLIDYAVKAFNQTAMRKLMDEESFDLIIQGYVMNDFYLGLAAHFKCPVILTCVIQPFGGINTFVGNPMEVSYVPSLLIAKKQPLGFFERVHNFLYKCFMEDFLMTIILDWWQVDIYRTFFPPDKYPSFDDMKKNVSLVFTNHHFSQTPIRPNVPAMVEIGGVQIKDKPDPLPEDIKIILDGASKHGAIYFSLGSNVQGKFLDSAKVKIIFDVLSKLPQTVLCKWGDAEKPGNFSNIVFKSWLPQDDILNHKNVKLFVTHAGQGSVVESQYHGVPMVGIPLFGDQPSNMENVVKEGFGVSVDYETINEKDFSNALNEVLTNTKYRDNVQRFAKLYKDRPMTARETAVFWVEYVLRHHGAPHMQSPAVHMNTFQLLSLDVIGFLLAVLYIFFKIIKLVFLFVKGLFGKAKRKTE